MDTPPIGRLSYAMGQGMRYDYSYYPGGQLKEKKASGRTLLAYTYDLNGNKVSQRDITGKQLEYRYNQLDLLTEIYDNGTRQAVYEYNQDYTIKKLIIGQDLFNEYGYDQDKNMISLYSKAGNLVLADNHYRFDGNGNYKSETTLNGVTNYSYDNVNRLVKVSYPEYEERFYYDRSGNRTKRLVGDLEENYQYNERNQLTERHVNDNGQQNRFEYQYDKQGNLLKDDKADYSYNSFNRVERVRMADGNTQVNRYDAEGLRHEMEENGKLVQFLFSGREVVAEIQEDGNIIRYIRGYDLISSDSENARNYYHYACDEMGSITHVLNGSDGQVLNEYRYDAFGNAVLENEQVANRFRYTGQQYDGITGQYYLRARFYNPVIGRFTQQDTYYGDGLNLYAYCANNPVGHYDPTGNVCETKYQTYKRLREQFKDWTAKQTYDYMKYRYEQGLPAAEAYKRAIGRDPIKNPSALTSLGNGTWRSPEGLIYGQGSVHGNRVNHVLDHTVPNPNKPVHTVFNVGRDQLIGLIDDAWRNRGRVTPSGPASNGNITYDIPMNRVIGTNGETTIMIVVRDGTSEIITAYPR